MPTDSSADKAAPYGTPPRRTIEAVYEAYDVGYPPAWQFPRPEWEMAPTGDFDVVTFRLSVAPNAFHRIMQRVFFGFVWRKMK